jgi:hypothetical protein
MNDAIFTDHRFGPVVGVYRLGRRMASASKAVEVRGFEPLASAVREQIGDRR